MNVLENLCSKERKISDNEMFKFDEDVGAFRYIGPLNVPIIIPNGTRSISYMFENLEFKEGACIITEGVCHIDDAKCAFRRSKFNKEFWSKSSIDFSFCTDMTKMFNLADLSLLTEFPDMFTTINVVKFTGMFAGAVFGDSFFVGNGFSTGLAKDMSVMFAKARMPKHFYLNDMFEVPYGCDSYHTWNFDESRIVTDEWKRVLGD